MKKCYVTKFGTVVDNPDLTVFETMQQYTLDVIAASGNTSMTDAQKWALNHLFYTLGKFDDADDSIWNKVGMIGLPIIAGEKAKATLDYTSPSDSGFIDRKPAYVQESLYDFVDKGLIGNDTTYIMVKVTDKNINSTNVSVFIGFSEMNKQNSELFGIYDGDTKKVPFTVNGYTDDTTAQNFGFALSGYAERFAGTKNSLPSTIQNFNIKNWNQETSDGISGHTINNNSIVPSSVVVHPQYYVEETYTSKKLVLNVKSSSASNPINMIIVSEGLTATQAAKIVDAMNTVRNEFWVNV